MMMDGNEEPVAALPSGVAQGYEIDLGWYEQQGRSFTVVAQSRLCFSCQSKLGSEVEERRPTYDARTKRVVFVTERVFFGANPFAVIRDCCGKKADFITPRLPLVEAIFRLFLLRGNQPLTVPELRAELMEWMGLPEVSPKLATDFLERLLRRDEEYGICPVAGGPDSPR